MKTSDHSAALLVIPQAVAMSALVLIHCESSTSIQARFHF